MNDNDFHILAGRVFGRRLAEAFDCALTAPPTPRKRYRYRRHSDMWSYRNRHTKVNLTFSMTPPSEQQLEWARQYLDEDGAFRMNVTAADFDYAIARYQQTWWPKVPKEEQP